MTKHGHQSYGEFCERWNDVRDNEAFKNHMYDNMKERFVFKWRSVSADIAILNIEEAAKECDDYETFKTVLKNVIDRYHERKRSIRW